MYLSSASIVPIYRIVEADRIRPCGGMVAGVRFFKSI